VITIMAAKANAEPEGAVVNVAIDVEINAPGQVEVTAPPAPEEQRFAVGLRAGLARVTQTYAVGSPAFVSPGPSGTGLLLELGAGARMRPWLFVGGFAATSSIADDSVQTQLYYDLRAAIRNRMFDVGAQVRLHAGGAFVGALVGLEVVRSRYDWHSTAPSSAASQLRWYTGVLGGIEIGYRARSSDGLAPELALAVTHTDVAEGDDVFPEALASSSLVSVRAMAGVAF
jgi:hypothetical protein